MRTLPEGIFHRQQCSDGRAVKVEAGCVDAKPQGCRISACERLTSRVVRTSKPWGGGLRLRSPLPFGQRKRIRGHRNSTLRVYAQLSTPTMSLFLGLRADTTFAKAFRLKNVHHENSLFSVRALSPSRPRERNTQLEVRIFICSANRSGGNLLGFLGSTWDEQRTIRKS